MLNGVNTVSVTFFALVKLYKVEFTKSPSAMIGKNLKMQDLSQSREKHIKSPLNN